MRKTIDATYTHCAVILNVENRNPRDEEMAGTEQAKQQRAGGRCREHLPRVSMIRRQASLPGHSAIVEPLFASELHH